MLELILRAVGIAVYATLVVGIGVMLFRRARQAGLLGPVLAGALARLAIVLAAHFASVLLGQHGFFYGDDHGYLAIGNRLAQAWEHGHLVNPTAYAYVGSTSVGYPLLVGFVVLLAGPHILAVTASNVLLGAASVYLVGRLGQLWFSDGAGVRAAWLLALLPTLVWWSAAALKENLAVLLVLAALLGASRPGRFPTGLRVLLPLAALTSVRLTDTIAVALGLVAARAVLLLKGRRGRSLRPLAHAGLGAVGVLAVGLVIVSAGDPSGFIQAWSAGLSSTHALYGHGSLLSVPGNVARTFIAPYPWVFTHTTFGWYMPLYPGTWVLIMLYPTALLGLWRIRHRRDLLLLVVVTVGSFMVMNAYALGDFMRQRASIEPLLVLLVIAGARSWRVVIRGAALALALLAPFTLAQSHRALVPALLLLGAVVLAGVARLIPDREFDQQPSAGGGAAIGPIVTARGLLGLAAAGSRTVEAVASSLRVRIGHVERSVAVLAPPPGLVIDDPGTARRSFFLAVALLLALLIPAGNLPVLAGIPLNNPWQIAGPLLVLPAVISRTVRSKLVFRFGGMSSRRAVVLGAVLGIAVASKLALLAGGAHQGWEACYHPLDAPQLAAGCERSYDNVFFLNHATRIERQLNYGQTGTNQPSSALSQSNWDLSFFNSKRWNRLQPSDYRDHLPFSVVWTASAARDARTVRVSYVGQGTIQDGSQFAVLPPSYGRPRTLLLDGLPANGAAVVQFWYLPSGPAQTRQYASFRLEHLQPAAPAWTPRLLAWLVDLPLFAVLAGVLLAWIMMGTRNTWGMLTSAGAALLLASAAGIQFQVIAALVVVLAWVSLRPSWRMLVFAAWAVVVIYAVRAGHLFPDWHAVVYRSAGNDGLTYESLARSILESGSLRGGESVYFMQPAYRYLLFTLRALFGDGDAGLSVAVRSLIILGPLAAVAIASVSLARRPRARWLCFLLGAAVVVMLNDNGISQLLDSGISEWPVWAGLPAGAAVLIFARDRRWLLAGTVVLATCVLSRSETLPAVSALLAIGLARWFVRDRPWTLRCGCIYLGILLLPLAHNLIYGGRAVLFTTSGAASTSFPLSSFPKVFGHSAILGRFEHQLQGIVLASSSSGLELVARGLQVIWVLTVVCLVVYWGRSSPTAKAVAALPLLFFAPFLVYDVFNYYPRHVVAGFIMMAVSLMIVAALGEIPLPAWCASVARFNRDLIFRLRPGSLPSPSGRV